MSDLYVTFAIPNPSGKDRTPSNQVTNDQLNGEWVQFQNTTERTLSLEGVALAHVTFGPGCRPLDEDRLVTFSGSLSASKSVRVHSGSGTGWWEGDVFHFYLGRRNFAWNNACGDRVQLRNARGQSLDWATYDSHPGEGQLLRRVAGTNRLQ